MNPSKKGARKKISRKKTNQGNGTFSKRFHNKRAKTYKKRYRGQGK